MKVTVRVSLILAVSLAVASGTLAEGMSGHVPHASVQPHIRSGELGSGIEQIDILFEEGLEENYHEKGVGLMKEALDLCLALNESSPNNYEVLWRCARSAGEYAESAKGIEIEGWQNICREWGKKGLAFAQAAQAIEPNRVEAYFWEVQCVGAYAAASGVWTAIREGFVGITRRGLDKTLQLDRSYMDYTPLFACAIFNMRCPGFLGGDKEKGYRCFNEFVENATWSFEPHIKRPLAAELLIKKNGTKNNWQARELLESVLDDPKPRKNYARIARTLMAKLGATDQRPRGSLKKLATR